jgi:hypothetical protein
MRWVERGFGWDEMGKVCMFHLDEVSLNKIVLTLTCTCLSPFTKGRMYKVLKQNATMYGICTVKISLGSCLWDRQFT